MTPSKPTCLCGKEGTHQLMLDIQSVLSMLEGDTERKKIVNYIKEYLLK